VLQLPGHQLRAPAHAQEVWRGVARCRTTHRKRCRRRSMHARTAPKTAAARGAGPYSVLFLQGLHSHLLLPLQRRRAAISQRSRS
jgi:hypothetical protein